tara:strand:+ start:316 stop:507 length:192 start_codon:yes stop_codon:yes gene_type:complete
MSKKIKVELTEKQLLSVTNQLGFNLIDLSAIVAEGGEDYQTLRVMLNAKQALIDAHEEWKASK